MENQRFAEQDENGIDLSLLRANLRLTPTERLEKHDRALELVLEVRRAAKEAGIWHDLSGDTTSSLRQSLAPVHAQGKAITESDEELETFFDNARDEVYQERQTS